jgi:uncharacterized protein YjbJ (UPF0337 family)
MGKDDKLSNKLDEMQGEAKEKVGDATGDKGMQRQGQRDQTKADVKQAGEKLKDAAR